MATLVPATSLPVTAVGALYTVHRDQQNALTLCLADGIDVLLTDNTAARLAAKSLNITKHGTLACRFAPVAWVLARRMMYWFCCPGFPAGAPCMCAC